MTGSSASRPMTVSAVAFSALLVLSLGGCSLGGDPAAEEPDEPVPAESEPQQPADGIGDTECVVGRWSLDVASYRIGAEQYLLGLGVPITEFDMVGAQILTITQDGLLAVDTNLRTSGVIVAGDSIVPISVTTEESATAEWGWDATSPSGSLLEVAEWQVVESSVDDGGIEGLEVPPPRFEGDDAVLLVDCDAQTMLLQGGGPLSALFVRD